MELDKDSYEYDAFGNTLNYAEKVANRFRYAREQFDRTTGHYYLRARYYAPNIGRFTQEDTYRGDGLNLYAYVSNNPVRYVDPSGHCKDGLQPSTSNSLGTTPMQYYTGINPSSIDYQSTTEAIDKVHNLLDVAGLVPGFGEAADGVNALIYLARGDKLNAYLSVGAMIPIGGWVSTGGKFTNKGIKTFSKEMAEETAEKITKEIINETSEKAVKETVEVTVKALDDIPMSRLDYHFKKHKGEFVDLYGNLSKDDYLNKARQFVTQDASDSVEMLYRGNGDKVIFNKTTQEFGVQTKDGLIKTYFVPDPAKHGYKTNYDYFKAQQ